MIDLNFILYIIALVFGAIIGSFLNVVVFRLKIKKSGRAELNLKGRSKCPQCQKTLETLDLIPIFSYFILRGRCRHCQESISLQYPIVELVTGVLTVLIFYFLGFANIYSYLILPIIYLLIIIFFYDLNNFIIPDAVLVPLFCLIIIFDIIKMARHDVTPLNLIFGLLIGGGLFLILVYFSKEKWMGWGDVKLGFLLGLLLSYPFIIVSHVLAFILGACLSLILIAFKGKSLKSQIPFAPFLVLAGMITLFWGAEIINWYLRGF